jgi:2-polyprenyl-3-methyl-5-hydroxy-6-metoxy-1,4-benzoquinol methylase
VGAEPAIPVDAAAESRNRERLLSAFRNGQGVMEDLAAEAGEVLRRTWPENQSIFDVGRDELLAVLLQSFPVFPVWLEISMTRRRLALLFMEPRNELAPLVAALAIQCHLNEYAWNEDPAETERVEALAARLTELTPYEVMLLACYRPLAQLPGIDALLSRDGGDLVRRVLHEQVVTVRQEEAIAASLPALTSVRGEVSGAVRAQYETNPYPRWRRVSRVPALTHVHGRPVPPDAQVLIAGCGTGKHPVQAAQSFPGARILAVDLSRTSLAYAARKTRELGLDNRITYAQADILELEGEARFDMVQSTGVLHHMADPFEGARRVCRLAKPGGLIALGLYSRKARAHLEPAKALAKSYTPQTVRDLRQAIISLPPNHPARAGIVLSRDFYSLSGCRDLLMHVQEHQLTIPDLRRMLDENGLTFLGFTQFTFKAIREPYRAMFPHDPEGLDLDAWDAFEAVHPRVFGRMYQFWAQKRA